MMTQTSNLVEDVSSPRHIQMILLRLDLPRVILLSVRNIQVISLVCISKCHYCDHNDSDCDNDDTDRSMCW